MLPKSWFSKRVLGHSAGSPKLETGPIATVFGLKNGIFRISCFGALSTEVGGVASLILPESPRFSMPNITGRPTCWTMGMNGGSSAPYLARTLCVPLFCTLFNTGGNRRAFRLLGAGGDFHCTVEPSPGHIRCEQWMGRGREREREIYIYIYIHTYIHT